MSAPNKAIFDAAWDSLAALLETDTRHPAVQSSDLERLKTAAWEMIEGTYQDGVRDGLKLAKLS